MSYYLYTEDLCNNFFAVDNFNNLNEILQNQQNWTIYCDKYDKNSACYKMCKSYITKNKAYCCDNQCSSKPCDTMENKWCLYKEHISHNIKYTKQILEININAICPDHPFGLPVTYVDNEQEAYNWINSNDS